MAKRTIQERYENWRKDHPEVYKLFEQYVLQMVVRKEKFGISLIAERIRWYGIVKKGEKEQFKIPNSYRSRIIRDIIKRWPNVLDYVEIRDLRTP